jgi:hypothetical protein
MKTPQATVAGNSIDTSPAGAKRVVAVAEVSAVMGDMVELVAWTGICSGKSP